MRISVITDSTAALPEGYAAAHDVRVLPQAVVFDQEMFLENVTITMPEYMRRVRSSPHLPKTAAPSPGEFAKAFNEALATAQTIISIHASAAVSGTIRSAETARAEQPPTADIRIVDSRTAGGCLGAMVMKAVEGAENGLPADAIVSTVQSMIGRTHTYFLVPTLEYLRRGGRIGGAAALVGSLLQITPILTLRDGRVDVLEKVRTYAHARRRMVELTGARCPRSSDSFLCVMHADALEEAKAIAAELRGITGMDQLPILDLSASIATQCGPGTLSVGFLTP